MTRAMRFDKSVGVFIHGKGAQRHPRLKGGMEMINDQGNRTASGICYKCGNDLKTDVRNEELYCPECEPRECCRLCGNEKSRRGDDYKDNCACRKEKG